MIACIVLVFVLTWGVSTALVGVVSAGSAPLWFLVAAPLLVSLFVAVLAHRSVTPESGESDPGRRRVLIGLDYLGERFVDVVAFMVPLAATGLLFVMALPTPNAPMGIAGWAILVCSAGGGFALMRRSRL